MRRKYGFFDYEVKATTERSLIVIKNGKTFMTEADDIKFKAPRLLIFCQLETNKIVGTQLEKLYDFDWDQMSPDVAERRKFMDILLFSIKDIGILAPLVLVSMRDGTYRVRNGPERLAAARKLGLGTVPALVNTSEDDPFKPEGVHVLSLVDAMKHYSFNGSYSISDHDGVLSIDASLNAQYYR